MMLVVSRGMKIKKTWTKFVRQAYWYAADGSVNWDHLSGGYFCSRYQARVWKMFLPFDLVISLLGIQSKAIELLQYEKIRKINMAYL